MAKDEVSIEPIEIDMVDVGEVLIQAYKREASIWSEGATADIHEFINEAVLQTRHTSLITTEGIAELRDKLFKSELVADFVQSLSYRFFAYWGRNQAGIDQLCEVLAVALTQPTSEEGVSEEDDEVLLPADYSTRYHDQFRMFKVLSSNRWFTIICLIRLFIETQRNAPPKKVETKPEEG